MSEQVPREFVGLARALHGRVKADTLAVSLIHAEILKYCRAIITSRPGRTPMRPEHRIHIQNLWTSYPSLGAFQPTEIKRTSKTLSLRQLRLVATASKAPEWHGKESILLVEQMEFVIDKRGVNYRASPLISVSLHALARRYQRALGATSDTVIKNDLFMAVPRFLCATNEEGEAHTPFTVRIPAGEWKGEIYPAQTGDLTFLVLAIRTFV